MKIMTSNFGDYIDRLRPRVISKWNQACPKASNATAPDAAAPDAPHRMN
jgi:hypothetical protein